MTKKKTRCECEKNNLVSRIHRIEGQVKAIGKMIEADAYCVDLLMQISAVRSALGSLSKVVIENHINSCVVEGIKQGNNEVIGELTELINKYFK